MPRDNVVYVHHRSAEFNAFKSPTGMSGRWVTKQAHKVSVSARVLAPKPGQGKGYATSETAQSIKVKRTTVGRLGPEVEIISDTDHAIYVHEPTIPHIIKSRLSERLIFFSKKTMQIHFAKKVFHPGTKGNPFLTNALRVVFGGIGR